MSPGGAGSIGPPDVASVPMRAAMGRRAQLAVAAAIYLACSLGIWAHVWLTGDPSTAVTCSCGDPVEQLWWFEWLPQAILHGHNPFVSNALFARLGGINAMANTSWMLPAAVLSPITIAFGPIASSNVANLVAPMLSGVAAFALAARFVERFTARLVAGALFAFSPFVLGNVDLGHVNLTLLAYMPLALLIGHRLYVGEISARRAGGTLGVLSVLQFFQGVEVLVLTAIVAASVVVVLAAQARLVARAAELARACGIAAAIAAACLAYPAWQFFAGPRRVAAPYWPLTSPSTFAFLFPRADAHSPFAGLRTVGYEGARGPGTGFIGIGVIVIVVVGYLLVADRRRYGLFAAVAAWCLVLEAMPNAVWAHLPVLEGIVRVRFATGVALMAGLMLAMGIEGWCAPTRPISEHLARRAGAWGSRAAAAVCVAIAIAPIVQSYSLPFTVGTAHVPSWFEHARVPEGTAVLAFPFAWGVGDEAMAWQAETHISFALVGGFGFVPGGNGVNDEFVSHLPIAELLIKLSAGTAPMTDAELSTLDATLHRWAPLDVVVVDGVAAPSVSRYLDAILGAPTSTAYGATEWTVRR